MKSNNCFDGMDLNTEERAVCRKNPIQAIQMYRRRTGYSLKEARNAMEEELGMDPMTYPKIRERMAFALFYQDNIIEKELSEFSEEDFQSSLNDWKEMKNYLREHELGNYSSKFQLSLKQWKRYKSCLSEEPWKDGKHYGDCTNIPLACKRCYIEYYYEMADKIIDLDCSELIDEL